MPGFRWSLAALAGVSVLCSKLAVAEPSAADKAAARQVATEGIQLFEAQKYEDALDRLRRAQALYDVPVHLLYMARAEEKLGRLVEASEHYRQLDRYQLPANAPEAWVGAVEAGRKELAAVEPRVPKLRVLTEPATQSATLRIDGAEVSSAVIGIPRPIDPGKHRVELGTPGKAPLSTEVDVAEGTTRDVVFKVGDAAAAAAPAATGVVAERQPPPTQPEREEPFVGFLGGVRLGAAIPFGTLFHFTPTSGSGTDVVSSDYRSAGGGVEFHAGARLGKYVTPVVFLEASALGHPSKAPAGIDREITGASAGSFGLGVLVGTPPGKVGGFGEFDLGLIDVTSVQFAQTTVFGRTIPECKIDASGASLRVGGGATFPVAPWLQLSPVALASVGRYSKLDVTGCDAVGLPSDLGSDDQRTHGMLFFGVGGDVVLGGRH